MLKKLRNFLEKSKKNQYFMLKKIKDKFNILKTLTYFWISMHTLKQFQKIIKTLVYQEINTN